jgi:hypothetical protein
MADSFGYGLFAGNAWSSGRTGASLGTSPVFEGRDKPHISVLSRVTHQSEAGINEKAI